MPRWDVFCRVIDNYGDVGVLWRLARQLRAQYQQEVRIWLDDVAALAAIWHEVDSDLAQQVVAGITVLRWDDAVDWAAVEVADVVIEGFACKLPEAYMAMMAAANHAPRWANLEYLTAEPWADGCHLLESPQAFGLRRVFFFPGFSDATGGLLREVAARGSWSDLTGFAHQPDALKVVLFGYERMRLREWLPCLAAGHQPVQIAVASGQATLAMHQVDNSGLQIKYLPMMRQTDFDALLNASDFNCVRGEDSFVRALWAGVPFAWHIYEQDDGVHWLKLEAFMQRYGAGRGWQNWQRFWNGDQQMNAASAWRELMDEWLDTQKHAAQKRDEWMQRDGLTQQLVRWSGVCA